MSEPGSFVFTTVTGARPVTLNAERRASNHYRQNSQTQAWKTAAGWALHAAKLTKVRFEAVHLHFVAVYPPRSGILPDTGALYPCEKAIEDAIVAAEIIPDDNRWHVQRRIVDGAVVSPTFAEPGIICTVTEVDPHPDHDDCRCRKAPRQTKATKVKSTKKPRSKR